ncbi:hypothetical protein RJT34_03024 [Clitoria ternatea]|uniref:Uncharacterized protein n=1 Tax=Clitoria ternatea TaxID=43366 RepID=A0AAN9KI55_CLITE
MLQQKRTPHPFILGRFLSSSSSFEDKPPSSSSPSPKYQKVDNADKPNASTQDFQGIYLGPYVSTSHSVDTKTELGLEGNSAPSLENDKVADVGAIDKNSPMDRDL